MKPAWKNSTSIFLDTDDFAVWVTVRLQAGGGAPDAGDLRRSVLNAETGEYELDTSTLRLTRRWTDVQDVTRGDTVEVDGRVLTWLRTRSPMARAWRCWHWRRRRRYRLADQEPGQGGVAAGV